MSTTQPPRPDADSTVPWRIIVPVKDTVRGKSRLEPPPGISRNLLAMSIALDTLTAARACVGAEAVVLVTDDDALAAHARAWGIDVAPDPGEGLDAAVLAGARHARMRAAEGGLPTPAVAALLGDLPGLHPDDLTRVLECAQSVDRGYLADHVGTGTVLLTASPGVDITPAFGDGSAARHAAVATDLATLTAVPARLRLDVDDLDSLRQVARLGVGRHTAMVLSMGNPM